jgi:hypothetical protein
MENAKAGHRNILKLGKNHIVEIFIALVTEEQCQIFVFQNFEIQKFHNNFAIQFLFSLFGGIILI